MQKALEWIIINKENILSLVQELLSIPSISAETEHRNDVITAAQWVKSNFERLGLEAMLFETKGYPVVFAQTAINPAKPTVLCYFHYDVQPVGEITLWKYNPFKPTVEEGKMFARGSTDDKMQGLVHIFALEALIKSGEELPVNFKFCIEGEEEISSPHVMDVVKANKDLFLADYIIISDGPMLTPDKPSMEVGARGILYTQIRLTTGKKDLHSGQFGGIVKNANLELMKIVTKLKNENGQITIPGFYDGIVKPSEEELESWQHADVSPEEHVKNAEVFALDSGEEGFSLQQRNWTRPTMEVNGMWGGFMGEGAKTVIPHEAYAKISFRLVPGQDPNLILEKFKGYLEEITPSGVNIEVEWTEMAPAFYASPDEPVFELAREAYEEVYGTKALLLRTGGTIGLLTELKNLYGVPVLLMNFGSPDENMHAPNEFMRVENFFRGIEVSLRLWYKL